MKFYTFIGERRDSVRLDTDLARVDELFGISGVAAETYAQMLGKSGD